VWNLHRNNFLPRAVPEQLLLLLYWWFKLDLVFFLNEYVQLRKQPRIPLDSRPLTCLDPMNQPSFSRYEADPELPEIEEEEEAIL
jgi:hypothetical protein